MYGIVSGNVLARLIIKVSWALKSKIIAIISICLISSLLSLALIETVLEKPYGAAKAFLRNSIQNVAKADSSLNNFKSNCSIPRVTDVSPGSTIIIGHAYGTPGGDGQFISDAAEQFILKHRASLVGVIFSGDIFQVPSAAKWAKLEALSAQAGVKFYVAPGNHDVGFGDNPSRDVWNLSGYSLPKTTLERVTLSGFSVLLEDSVVSGWQLSPMVFQALNDNFSNAPVALVRHHVAAREMLAIANSQAGYVGELPAATDLASKIPKGTTIISGDTGAFSGLPRVACFKVGHLTFLASGIGGLKDDVLLVLHEGEIQQISL